MSGLLTQFSQECFIFDIRNAVANIYILSILYFTLLFVPIRCLKKELVFHCHTSNDIFYCDIGTVMSRSEINVFMSVFIVFENLRISQNFMLRYNQVSSIYCDFVLLNISFKNKSIKLFMDTQLGTNHLILGRVREGAIFSFMSKKTFSHKQNKIISYMDMKNQRKEILQTLQKCLLKKADYLFFAFFLLVNALFLYSLAT